jgi:RNA polymerase sigma factor (sigma-70 family)
MAGQRLNGVLTQIRKLFTAQERDALSDRELLNRYIKDRDEAAVTALIERHGAMTLGICRRVLGRAHDAEDACQATFLVLVRKAASVRKKESLASWLHGVAYHIATNLKRDLARRRSREGAVARAPQHGATEDLTWREVQAVLDEELARLPDRFRGPLVLCYLEGKTRDEAARQLRWTPGTLRGRLQRGRELLRARLTRRGLAFSAALAACHLGKGAASAAMSSTLVISTIKAVMATGNGEGAASGAVPANVAALSEGMVKAMFFKKLKITAVLLLAVAAGGIGLALGMGLPRADAGGAAEQPAAGERPEPGADAGAKGGEEMSRPIRSLAGHKERVTSVAYSPDGRWLATAAWDGTVRLWDSQTGEEVRRLDVPPTRNYKPASLREILFSPDNEFVVVAQQAMPNEPGVIVWNRRSGERVREFQALCAAFSPDGQQIACGGWDVGTPVIRLYEFATGKLVREMRGHQTVVESLVFSPDGTTLFSRGRLPRPLRVGDVRERLGEMPDIVRVWDVATGTERRSGLQGLVAEHVALSPDGRTLAASSSLHETATGGQRARLIGHTNTVCAVAFSPDGRTLASGSMDGTVRLWDLPSGKEVGRLGKEVPPFAGRGWVLAVAFSPDGRTLASGGLDQTVHLWDVSRITGRRSEPAERSAADLEADWRDLAGDAAAGYAALGRLVSSPVSAVAFLGKQLRDTVPVDNKRIERLLADLDDGQFQVREQATRELEALAERAAPALRMALAGSPSPEARRRLVALLDRLDGASPSAETVRQIRAVEALESLGNAEARRLLDQLAAGPAEARLTQEARAAAGRLARPAAFEQKVP